jgi:hypothetical protein
VVVSAPESLAVALLALTVITALLLEPVVRGWGEP